MIIETGNTTFCSWDGDLTLSQLPSYCLTTAPSPVVGGLEAIMASPKESRGSPGGGLLKNQASGKSFMGNMIDTLFMRNVTLKGRTSKATEASLDDANQVLCLLYFVLCHRDG